MRRTVIFLLCAVILLSFGAASFAARQYVYKHVIVVGIDGAGNFKLRTPTPNMDSIFEKGASSTMCRASIPTISAQNWGSMLIGVTPQTHKLTNEIISRKAYKSDRWPTVFRLIRDAMPGARLGSFCNWNPINYGIVEQDLQVDFATADDAALTLQITNYIIEKKPEFLFIQFDNVDHAGHTYGYGSEKHLETLTQTDRYVGIIYDAIKGAGILEDTLFIVTADHGGIGYGHGGVTDEEKYVFFGAAGRTVIRNKDLDLYSRDLAAIVCRALGVKPNPGWDSYVPRKLFSDDPSPRQRPKAAAPAPHKNAPTPTGSKALTGSMESAAKLLRCAFMFDGSLDSAVGTEKLRAVGTPAFEEGWYGQGVRLDEKSWLSFPDLAFGDKSFSVCVFMKQDAGIGGDPAVFSNKDWANGCNKGFVYCYRGTYKFNAGDGDKVRSDFDYVSPEAPEGRWTHVILSVDREKGAVDYYSDFVLESSDLLAEGLKGVSFDSGLPFNLGSDGTDNPQYKIRGVFDDLLIFDKALTPEEVQMLKEYYKG
ncbi:MAG: alkaline phosphatase family protein [Abditibacteriota bacterium]|nr:alkaline phosphatase family protein [Abditibacteriota bacterium]